MNHNEALQGAAMKAAKMVRQGFDDFDACKRNTTPSKDEIAAIIYQTVRDAREL